LESIADRKKVGRSSPESSEPREIVRPLSGVVGRQVGGSLDLIVNLEEMFTALLLLSEAQTLLTDARDKFETSTNLG
jgi:hypothetical protein